MFPKFLQNIDSLSRKISEKFWNFRKIPLKTFLDISFKNLWRFHRKFCMYFDKFSKFFRKFQNFSETGMEQNSNCLFCVFRTLVNYAKLVTYGVFEWMRWRRQILHIQSVDTRRRLHCWCCTQSCFPSPDASIAHSEKGTAWSLIKAMGQNYSSKSWGKRKLPKWVQD